MGLAGLLNVLAHISLLRYCIACFSLVTYLLFESRQLLTCAVRGTVPMSKTPKGVLAKSFRHLIWRPWSTLPVAFREYVSTIRQAGNMLQVNVSAFHILLKEVVCMLF